MKVSKDELWFERLGHASIVIGAEDNYNIYIDPWSEVLGSNDWPKASLILVTHDDHDHYDHDAIVELADENTVVVAYEEIDTQNLHLPVVELQYGGELTLDGIKIQAIPAYNRPDGDHTHQGEPLHAKGEVIGLVLTIDETTIYYASDTDFLDEHRELTADVFVPPIGGLATMDRHQAADFTRSMQPDLVLPVHYTTEEEAEDVPEVQSHFVTDAEQFKRDVENTSDAEVRLF